MGSRREAGDPKSYFLKMSLAGWVGGELQDRGGKGWGLDFVVTAD